MSNSIAGLWQIAPNSSRAAGPTLGAAVRAPGQSNIATSPAERSMGRSIAGFSNTGSHAQQAPPGVNDFPDDNAFSTGEFNPAFVPYINRTRMFANLQRKRFFPAFRDDYTGALHPRPQPPHGKRMPWLWSILLTEDLTTVNMQAESRHECNCTLAMTKAAEPFATKVSHELQKILPEMTGNRTCSEFFHINTQVHADEMSFFNVFPYKDYYPSNLTKDLAAIFYCRFFSADGKQHALVRAELQSHAGFKRLHILCRIPDQLRDELKNQNVPTAVFDLVTPPIDERLTETQRNLVAQRAFDSKSVYSRFSSSITPPGQDKKFNVALCVALGASKQAKLREWITFHQHKGVEHIFMYDETKDGSICGSLTADILKGAITCVHWPYDNCGPGQRASRLFRFRNQSLINVTGHFVMPGVMAHIGALDSCYTRFSQFAVWLGCLDSDEFFVPYDERQTYAQILKPFQNNESVMSVAFRPIMMRPPSSCGDTAGYRDLVKKRSTPLCPDYGSPRLGSHCVAREGPLLQPKQFFKTASVKLAHIHYAALPRHENPRHYYLLDYHQEAFLAHFRHIDKSPGNQLDWASGDYDCRTWRFDDSFAPYSGFLKSQSNTTRTLDRRP